MIFGRLSDSTLRLRRALGIQTLLGADPDNPPPAVPPFIQRIRDAEQAKKAPDADTPLETEMSVPTLPATADGAIDVDGAVTDSPAVLENVRRTDEIDDPLPTPSPGLGPVHSPAVDVDMPPRTALPHPEAGEIDFWGFREAPDAAMDQELQTVDDWKARLADLIGSDVDDEPTVADADLHAFAEALHRSRDRVEESSDPAQGDVQTASLGRIIEIVKKIISPSKPKGPAKGKRPSPGTPPRTANPTMPNDPPPPPDLPPEFSAIPQLTKGWAEWWRNEGRKLFEARKNDPNRRIVPSESFIWQKLERLGGKSYRSITKGSKKRRYYTWDRGGGGRHRSEIEVWDKDGKHLGAIDPLTGKWVKGPDKRKKPLDVSTIENPDARRHA